MKDFLLYITLIVVIASSCNEKSTSIKYCTDNYDSTFLKVFTPKNQYLVTLKEIVKLEKACPYFDDFNSGFTVFSFSDSCFAIESTENKLMLSNKRDKGITIINGMAFFISPDAGHFFNESNDSVCLYFKNRIKDSSLYLEYPLIDDSGSSWLFSIRGDSIFETHRAICGR